MSRLRSSGAFLCLSLGLALASFGCKQGAGDRCEQNSDCSSGLCTLMSGPPSPQAGRCCAGPGDCPTAGSNDGPPAFDAGTPPVDGSSTSDGPDTTDGSSAADAADGSSAADAADGSSAVDAADGSSAVDASADDLVSADAPVD